MHSPPSLLLQLSFLSSSSDIPVTYNWHVWNFPTGLGCSMLFILFLLACQFGKFLLTSIQAQQFFPWPCWGFWWAHPGQSWFLLQNFQFLAFPFHSFWHLPAFIALLFSYRLSIFPLEPLINHRCFKFWLIIPKSGSYFSVWVVLILALSFWILKFGFWNFLVGSGPRNRKDVG